jgi:hypothetical protein
MAGQHQDRCGVWTAHGGQERVLAGRHGPANLYEPDLVEDQRVLDRKRAGGDAAGSGPGLGENDGEYGVPCRSVDPQEGRTVPEPGQGKAMESGVESRTHELPLATIGEQCGDLDFGGFVEGDGQFIPVQPRSRQSVGVGKTCIVEPVSITGLGDL